MGHNFSECRAQDSAWVTAYVYVHVFQGWGGVIVLNRSPSRSNLVFVIAVSAGRRVSRNEFGDICGNHPYFLGQ